MSPFIGLCAYQAAGLVSPAVSHRTPHLFWVTDNPASLCKAPWEDLSCCVPELTGPFFFQIRHIVTWNLIPHPTPPPALAGKGHL